MGPLQAAVAAFIAFVATIIAILALRPLCVRIGLVDHPDTQRKHHAAPTPLCGGLGILAGLVVALIASWPELGPVGGPFLVAMLPLLAVGLADDFVEISFRWRLVAQVLSALLMVYAGGVAVHHLGDLIEPGHVVTLGAWAVPLAVFCVVGIINGLNMLDGMDGLAGGVTFIALGWFATAAFLQGSGGEAVFIVALMGAVAGFLAFNLRHPFRARASVFLGDLGSTVLGFVLGWLSIHLTQVTSNGLPPMASVWIVGLPLLDALVRIVHRLSQRRSPMSADREHLHHLLLRAGFSHGQTVTTMFVVAGLFGAIGIGAWQAGLPMYVLFWGSLITFGLCLLVVTWGARLSRLSEGAKDAAG